MKKSPLKILLIFPPFYRLYKDTYSLDDLSLGLGYLAGAIKKNTSWNVSVYNGDFSPYSKKVKINYLTNNGFNNYIRRLNDPKASIWQEVKSTILKYKPKVIGITTTSQTFTSVCMVAKIAKETNPKIIVIVGGPHPSMAGRNILKNPNIDFAVKGEGELTIVELLKAIEGFSLIDNIEGIIYKRNGIIFENDSREFVSDLDELTFPSKNVEDYLKDYDRYPLMS